MLDEILFRNLLYINKIRERAYAEVLNQPVSDNLIFVAILSEMEILISFVIEYYALPRCAQILNRSRNPIIHIPEHKIISISEKCTIFCPTNSDTRPSFSFLVFHSHNSPLFADNSNVISNA
mgnify:FL=1